MGILALNQTVDQRFVVREFLGTSAVGEKYRVEDLNRGQQVAIKLLYEDIVTDAGGSERIRSQLNDFTQLSVPGIARIYDYGFTEAGLYLSMEFVTALPYIDWIKQQPRSESELHSLFGSLAEIIHAASPTGPHLGLKASNLFVTEGGNPITTDFGLNGLVSIQKLRASATLTGDRGYLPPEVFLDDKITPAAVDAFALGRLWLSALEPPSPRGSSRAKTTRLTDEWLPRLTHSNPPLRSTNFGELARALTPKSRSLTPEKRWLRNTPQSIGFVLGIVLILALTIGFTQFGLNWRQNRTSTNTQVSRASLAQDLQSAEHHRMALIKEAHRIPELFPLVFPSLREPFLLDAIQSLETYRSGDEEDLDTLQQSIRRYEQRLTILGQLLSPYAEIRPALRVADQLVTTPLPLAIKHPKAWQRDLAAINRSIERSDLSTALAGTTNLQHQLSQTLSKHWQTAVTQAKAARAAWIASLERRQLILVEPGEDLSSQLEALDTPCPLNEIPDRIEKIDQLQKNWQDWTQAHDALPLPLEHHFVNSLDMRFVSVGPLLASIWETRNLDFARHILESGLDRRYLWRERAAMSGPTHPVSNITQLDATAFCDWLTKAERTQGIIGPKDHYRLPSDLEWSRLAGLHNESGIDPDMRTGAPLDHVPWWPTDLPPKQRGNYYTWPNEPIPSDPAHYVDHYDTTAPVGSFLPNQAGIFDLAGNLWEWTSTPFTKGSDLSHYQVNFAIRGASWQTSAEYKIKTNFREGFLHNSETIGFRIVLDQTGATDERR